MTQRFWYHLVLCAALLTGVMVFIRFTGYGAPANPSDPAHGLSGGGIPGYLAALCFLYAFSRLALRVAGSDRTTGLLSVYAVSLFVPFVAAITASLAHTLALLLVSAAVLEIMDIDLARVNAVRSGLYMSAACVAEPACLVPAAALVPVAVAIARGRWTLPFRYLLAAAVPVALYHLASESGGAIAAATPLRDATAAWNGRAIASALSTETARIRLSWEIDLHSTYAAFALAGILAGTVRRLGPSRRGVLAIAWLLLVVTVAAALSGEESASLFRPLGHALLLLLAGAGLAALAAMNPLHAGRKRMIPVGVFFLLPQVVVWVRLLV